ncbi:MAG TPA: TonB-dependent receptor [Polyangiaceae bacterium]|nr:TonB-dependent receptor [Polyangiaceae bacterium]
MRFVVVFLIAALFSQGALAAQPEHNAAAASSSPLQSEITPPQLIQFEPAAYPPAAEAAGIEGSVVLRLTVEENGSVSESVIERAAGNDFDEPARQAALKFKFQPAVRDGVPVRAKILYEYRFTLTPKVPTPEQAAPPTGGVLRGKLLIAGLETPLSGAVVKITTPKGNAVEINTDAEGNWALSNAEPGNYGVHVEAEGFASVDSDEQITAGEETAVTYRASPEGQGVEVTVQGERPPREVTRRTIERREVQRVPGTSGDALRSLQSLPGLARAPGLLGLLVVRGQAPEDTETFVDGNNVPIIYHFGGLSSVIPTELLDRIDFYPGNFSARYGRVMGGIVDVGLRSADTQCLADYGKPSDKTGCYHGLLELDMIDSRAMVQGPVGDSKKWSFVAAGRRSWVDVWLTPVLKSAGAGVTSAPVYYDYQLIADYKPNANDRLSLRFYGSDDMLRLIIKDPAAEDPGVVGGNLTFHTGFYRAQALFDTKLTREVNLSTSVAAGMDQIEFTLGQWAFTIKDHPILSRGELQFKPLQGFKLNVGLDYQAAPFDLLVRLPEPPRPGEASPGPFTTRPLLEQREHGLAFRPGWYTEAEVRPTPPLLLVPGLRIDHARDSGHTDLSPRINARYDLIGGNQSAGSDKKTLRTTLKGGVGLYSQPPQFQETDKIFGTPGLESNRAVHYGLGIEQELTQHIEVSVEGYYKHLTHLVSRTPGDSGQYLYGNQGSGSVIGMETLLKYKADARFFGWLAYTLSRSVRRDADNLPEYLFQYDQTHILTVLGSYRLGRGWEAGARFRLVSGSLVTPIRSAPELPALYAADAAAYTPLQGRPFSRRVPLFHQLDLRIDKTWQFRSWKLAAFLDIWNAYNNAAVEDQSYNFNFTQRANATGLPIIPSLGLRGEI